MKNAALQMVEGLNWFSYGGPFIPLTALLRVEITYMRMHMEERLTSCQ